ncbi:MAG TPA: hypothetical protein VKE51_21315 [Vicinamibacterales bacterium]|nr:hypothetical protein [Vicinamibacterales bacterium]
MQRPPFTSRSEYALGVFALFLLGLVGAAAGLGDRVRLLISATSHKPRPVAIDRSEIR